MYYGKSLGFPLVQMYIVMIELELNRVENKIKVGAKCDLIEPNITEDCIFTENGEKVGFYIRDVSKYSKKLTNLLAISNLEFNSDRVPKTIMARTSAMKGHLKTKWEGSGDVADIKQLSTIIGSIAPKNFGRRPYPSKSSVHLTRSADTFVKAMLLTAKESEAIIKKILPEQYKIQEKLIKEFVPEKWRFGKLFTSSISNYNISANYHRDTGNIKGCVNVILTKRRNSQGGNLNVPDYGATIDQADNSMLVYPAWKDVHGVTPIIPTRDGGYRNSLIFYPLKAFKGFER